MKKISQITALNKGGSASPPMGRHPILPSASSVPRVHEGQVLPSPLSSPRQPPPSSPALTPHPLPSHPSHRSPSSLRQNLQSPSCPTPLPSKFTPNSLSLPP